MSDLISRPVLLRRSLPCPPSHKYADTTKSASYNAETVEAVPLLPLCKLLAEINGKPCYTQPGQEACEVTLGDFKCCGMNDEAGCWERLLRAWMNNGMEDYT